MVVEHQMTYLPSLRHSFLHTAPAGMALQAISIIKPLVALD